ncbi:hypothetical protein ACEQ8H_000092 [Pleosporales sp. CAS-2024a]
MGSGVAIQTSRRHPLQRFDSPSKGLSGVVHVAGLTSFYHSFKFISDNPNQFNNSFGWHLQFLTILGIAICTVCFSFGLVADLTNNTTLFRIKNYILLVAAPLEIVISILYWGLRAIDTALVVPPDLPLPPLLYDLTFHFFPAALTTLDALLLSPPWPSSSSSSSEEEPMVPHHAPFVSLALCTATVLLYWVWIEICYANNGFYPYPLFALLSTAQRIALFTLSGAIMCGVAAALRAAYACCNGCEGVVDELKQGKKRAGRGVAGAKLD